MTSTAEAPSTSSSTAPDSKILADLDVLVEKMDLCDSMLRPGGGDPAPSVQTNPTLLQVIGFIEACAPRMVELVEAAAQGALQEEALMKALAVNDRLTKLLTDIDTVALTETPASTTAAAAASTNTQEDLLFAEEDTAPTKSQDIFKSEGGPDAKAPAVKSSGSDDDFDSFFNERTSSGN